MNAQTLGRFTLIRKLPAGGMGRVFEAEDEVLARRVAVKLIDKGDDPDSMQILEAERFGAELQKRLSAIDSRVTAIYDFGELDPDYFFIAMEFVEGRDLSELMAVGIDVQSTVRICTDVLEVLDHAHNFSTQIDGRDTRGIVHGDLKPRNIRITSDGSVKVLDFGIAKVLSLSRTFTHNLFGSAAYSSPERLNSGEVNVSADLWSVAVVLYEMLAGKPYFEGTTTQQIEAVIRNYRELKPMPSGIPEGLSRVLRRALNPNPAARFASAKEFARALQESVADGADPEITRRVVRRETREDVATVASSRPVETEVTTRSAGSSPAERGRSKKRERRPVFRTLFQAVFAVVLILVIAAVILVVNEYVVWRDADQLARDVISEKQQNVDAAWQQYQKLSARSHVPVSLWSAQSALRDRLMGDADRVIAESRESDSAVVTEADWAKARAQVARALELDPHNRSVHGTLRLIDGQLERIRGTARHDPRMVEQSRQDFEQSARELNRSPDPWLGLARLYIYSLHDVDAGESALKESEKRGHDIGKRETSEIADGYRYRADQEVRLGDRSNPDDAERYYDMARNDIAHSRQLYESLMPWPNVASNLKKLDEMLFHISESAAKLRP